MEESKAQIGKLMAEPDYAEGVAALLGEAPAPVHPMSSWPLSSGRPDNTEEGQA